jgi:hypothetical protein
MMRTLRSLVFALAAAVVVFLLVIVTAWINVRDEPRVLERQYSAQNGLRRLGRYLDEFAEASQKENQIPPDKIGDLHVPANDPYIRTNERGDIVDEWDKPVTYEKTGDRFVAVSLGRDGDPGGVGPDADLYSDNRSRGAKSPSFRQFVTERDRREIVNVGFMLDGLFTATCVALTIFYKLRVQSKQGETKRLRNSFVEIVVLVGLTVLVGLMLLPLHIPNHH